MPWGHFEQFVSKFSYVFPLPLEVFVPLKINFSLLHRWSFFVQNQTILVLRWVSLILSLICIISNLSCIFYFCSIIKCIATQPSKPSCFCFPNFLDLFLNCITLRPLEHASYSHRIKFSFWGISLLHNIAQAFRSLTSLFYSVTYASISSYYV